MDSTTRYLEILDELAKIEHDLPGILALEGHVARARLRLAAEQIIATIAGDKKFADIEFRCEQHLNNEMAKTAHLDPAIRPHRDGNLRS